MHGHAFLTLLFAVLLVIGPGRSFGAVAYNLRGGNGLDGGSRWNAETTSFSTSGGPVERSLDGGLRYSIAGGSYQAYRDMFTWSLVPTAEAFETAVQAAFVPWSAFDPVTGLGTTLSFVEDLGTSVDSSVERSVRLGSEIDLLSGSIGSGTRGFTNFSGKSLDGGIALTSGTSGYAGFAITGADITMNNNAASWDLNTFQTILTHEIGHAIGLGDAEDFDEIGFIDNNYSASDPLGTLTDSWAELVDPLNPGASTGLALYYDLNNSNGIDAPGVDLLMESDIPATFFANGAALQNDDFGGRQFLYPVLAVPEPSLAFALAIIGVAGSLFRRRRPAIRIRSAC